ncbi:hypothetical protein UO65_0108 [Actinokineospora spheciospongiae]|uniref:Uncharacterized protein n=1 Tax=Actinokineospora spheciospongiae TaxID=909613 RepID=W7J654_9PSEU|nr:hypothetical protein UO65_0108 [Actinokineospora spheciospongiae]
MVLAAVGVGSGGESFSEVLAGASGLGLGDAVGVVFTVMVAVSLRIQWSGMNV